MKKFLAIDASSKYLTVIVYSDGAHVTYLPDCATNHSVVLMQAVEETFLKAGITAADCDFFAVCVGAGSFTGIRIGIAAVKGFAYAFNKPVLPVTSFQIAAYNTNGATLALVDALHGYYYVCGFNEKMEEDLSPRYVSSDEVLRLAEGRKIVCVEEIPLPHERKNAADGFLSAVLSLSADEKNFVRLGSGGKGVSALYIRKSQAEENLK